MSVVVVGLEQPRTPLDLLERVTVGEESLGKALRALRDRRNLSEVVVLSTCLRTELYAVVERFHEGVSDLQDFLASRAGTTAEKIAEHARVQFDDDVTVHLFEVAAGLRSAVLGETEVLGQVRRAAERAESEKAAGPVLSGLFRAAVQAGRKVRSSTAIARGSTSLSHVAVEVTGSHLRGSLVGKRVAVVGAGEIAEGVVSALSRHRVEEIVVANRTIERARALAATVGGRAEPLESLPAVLSESEAVIVTTSAPVPLLDAELVLNATGPQGVDSPESLVIVDMGMPRNVDPYVGELEQVTLLDIEDLNAHAELALIGRQGELAAARRIVAHEVGRYRAEERARGAGPVVAALRERLEELVGSELHRHRSRLAALGEPGRREVEALVRDVLAKLAHSPTVALKEAAGTPRGERLVEALRTLFDL